MSRAGPVHDGSPLRGRAASARARRWSRSPVAALALVASLAAAGLGGAPAIAAGALREAVARPLRAAQDAIQASRWADALSALDEAERIPARTPDEQLPIDRLRALAAERAGDPATAARALAAAFESPRLPEADRLPTLVALASLSMQSKAYAQAQRWASRYREAGGDEPAVLELLTRASFLAADLKTAATVGAALADRSEQAGRTPPEDLLRIVARACLELEDSPCLDRTLERLLRHHPKPEYWTDRIDRLTGAPGFASRLELDALRLLVAAQALTTPEAFGEAAELALKAGFPAEARRILTQGIDAGVLGGAEHRSRLARASRLADEDAAQTADALVRARAAPDADPLFSTGYGLATTGELERGIAVMREAIARGTMRHPAQARLRLGETLARAGRADEAAVTFQAIPGDQAEAVLARLWQLWAQGRRR